MGAPDTLTAVSANANQLVLGAILYLVAPVLIMVDPQHPPLSLDSGVGVLMAPLALQERVPLCQTAVVS